MATKTKKPAKSKKIGFQRLSKAERIRIASRGGKANVKKYRKVKKG